MTPPKLHELIVDASPVGLGAILTQIHHKHGNKTRKVVAYASRQLTDAEKRYSQCEKESLAIVYGVENFHIYLYGQTFNLHSDWKALESIFNNPLSKLPARIERWNLRLQQYDFTVKFLKGDADNPADFLSRHPDSGKPYKPKYTVAEEYVTTLTTLTLLLLQHTYSEYNIPLHYTYLN